MGYWNKIVETVLSAVVLFVFGWVVSALQTNKRLKEYDREVVESVRARLARIEDDYVKRRDFERIIQKLEADFEKGINLLRSDVGKISDKIDRIREH